MKNTRTCVITVNYKGADDTAMCVASLKRSTVPVAIVVVDNTPNDPALESALSPYSDIHLIQAPENLGFGRGNNLGIEWALQDGDYEFIFVLNNDATIKPDAIMQMEKAMDASNETAIVSPRVVLADDESKLWYGGGEVNWKRGTAKVAGFLGPADAPLAMQGRHVSFASGCAMLIRSQLLKRYGGFDERFFMYEEDLEISLRLQGAGWKIWYEPTAFVQHIGQGSQDKRNMFISRYDPKNPNLAFLVYHGIKNSLLNMYLHARSWNRLLFLSVFPVFLGLKIVQWGGHGRFDAVKSACKAIRDYRRQR